MLFRSPLVAIAIAISGTGRANDRARDDGAVRASAPLVATLLGAAVAAPIVTWISIPRLGVSRTLLVVATAEAIAAYLTFARSRRAAAATVALLVAIGLSAAYFGGWVDSVLMRLADIQLAFPGILIALVLLAVLGTGLDKVIIAIIAVQWAYYARTARSIALVERSKEYVLAAHNLQFSAFRIMFAHLLPNCVAALSVVAVVNMAGAIGLEATLSFLGVGLPITQPSLGLLIANGYSSMLTGEYWLSFYPGLVLLFLLIAINLIGERLRQLNDPRGLS